MLPRWSPAPLAACLCLACATAGSGDADAQRDPDPAPRSFESVDVEGEPMFTVLPPDEIASIDDPLFASASEADEFLEPHEPVLGVVGVDGSAKAYSAWQLDRHEIVNDWVDGEPIAATW